MKAILILFLSLISFLSYSQDEEYDQYDIDIRRTYKNSNILININNTLKAPLRLTVRTDNQTLNRKYKLQDTVLVKQFQKKQLKYYVPSKREFVYTIDFIIGDPDQAIVKNELALPFPKGKTYQIMQGYNGNFSHDDDYNKYAIDFDLSLNDTICSADDGFVVGVIKDYKYGGRSRAWRESHGANIITIYHPHSGLYTEYLHLVHKGSFVKVGDKVKKGQAIGLAGATGFATGPHLHFNALIPERGGTFISTPIVFENGIKGEDLIEDSSITNNY